MKDLIKNFLIVVLVTFFAASCDIKDKVVNAAKANDTKNCKSNLSKVQKRWELAFIDICDRIEGTEVKNLINVEIPHNSMEIRVWVGYDTSPLRGLFLKRDDEKWTALHLPPLEDLSSSSREPQTLPLPKSDWENLWKKLEGLDILTLPDTRDIGIDNSTLDNTSIVVEIKTSGSYRIYSYFRVDEIKRDEHKKVMEICDTLSNEFGVQLYKYFKEK